MRLSWISHKYQELTPTRDFLGNKSIFLYQLAKQVLTPGNLRFETSVDKPLKGYIENRPFFIVCVKVEFFLE